MTLRYLDFDHSEDTEGLMTFEAMACVSPDHVPAVLAEITQVLTWAFEAFPNAHGPLEEGFDWDHEVRGLREFTVSEAMAFDPVTRQLTVRADRPDVPRCTLVLSLSGRAAFGLAFSERFLHE